MKEWERLLQDPNLEDRISTEINIRWKKEIHQTRKRNLQWGAFLFWMAVCTSLFFSYQEAQWGEMLSELSSETWGDF